MVTSYRSVKVFSLEVSRYIYGILVVLLPHADSTCYDTCYVQEEPMEGCSDGTRNGIRYFDCHQGHGFFARLSSLLPDQRFAPATIVDANRKL